MRANNSPSETSKVSQVTDVNLIPYSFSAEADGCKVVSLDVLPKKVLSPELGDIIYRNPKQQNHAIPVSISEGLSEGCLKINISN